MSTKETEQKLRRTLNNKGYTLHKSRAPYSPDNLGGYMIVDTCGNYVVAGSRYEMTLQDVEKWLYE